MFVFLEVTSPSVPLTPAPYHPSLPEQEKTPALDVHSFTLLDGEMVIDSTPEGGQERRYLIYDLMIANGVSLKDVSILKAP